MTPLTSAAGTLATEDATINLALTILEQRLRIATDSVASPQTAKDYLTLKLAAREREVFGVLWLDVRNRVIAFEELFYGTLTCSAVYPREVVKSGLHHNAGACIAFHNHPSGFPEPSVSDKQMTSMLKKALAMVDIQLVDHLIVAGMKTLSFAESGLL